MKKKKFFAFIAFLILFIPQLSFSQTDWEAKWISQDQGTWGNINAHQLYPNETITLQAKFQNTGKQTWTSDLSSNNFVGFYVYKDLQYSTPPEFNNPQNTEIFGSTLFNGENWDPSFDGKTANARAAILKEDQIKPGEIGTFEFTLYSPDNTKYINDNINLEKTLYDERFHREDLTLAYGPNWMNNYTNGDPANKAHVWFPIRFEEKPTSLTQSELEIYAQKIKPPQDFSKIMDAFNDFESNLLLLGFEESVNQLEQELNKVTSKIETMKNITSPSPLNDFHQYRTKVLENWHYLFEEMIIYLREEGSIENEKIEQYQKQAQYYNDLSEQEIESLGFSYPKIDFTIVWP